MQSLLRWSIENSSPLDGTPSDRPPVERKKLDPGVIDMILGKPDAEQMKEDMTVAVDANRNEDERLDALDHLEMLVEHIDNANDLVKLKLWEPLQSLLTSPSSTPGIKTQALWIIGTAMQNNPSAQDVYLSYHPLPTLLSFLDLSTASSTAIRAKAIYALSGLLKHNAPAVQDLGTPEADGWTKLRDSIQDPEISVRRKIIFLLATLLTPTNPSSSSRATPSHDPLLTGAPLSSSTHGAPPQSQSTSVNLHTNDQNPSDPIYPNSHAINLQNPSRTSTSELALSALKEYKILDAVITALTNPLPYGEDGENAEADVDFEEKCMRLLYTYTVACREQLPKSQKGEIKSWIQSEKAREGEKQLLERWGFSKEEYAALIGRLL